MYVSIQAIQPGIAHLQAKTKVELGPWMMAASKQLVTQVVQYQQLQAQQICKLNI